MWSVQKMDFAGNYVEVFRSQEFGNAERFRDGIEGGTAKEYTRIIKV